MQFKLSLFENRYTPTPKAVERTWEQLCDRFATPTIRRKKDGLLFSPATFSPAHRLNENVIEISLLVLDCDHDSDLEALKATLRKQSTAFAIYSTHSHLRVTDKNPKAEPRYRVVVPLSEPIAAREFFKLWYWATDLDGMRADRQVKDVARIYYTPVKYSADSPYEYHIEPGPFLKWRELGLDELPAGGRDNQTVSVLGGSVAAPLPHPRVRDRATGQMGHIEAQVDGFVKVAWENGSTTLITHDQLVAVDAGPTSTIVDFQWHEDRHEELCRRIKFRGKRNGRGNYDARCLAHAGKGTTSLCYFPVSNAVVCNAGCEYSALLRAEGLSDNQLRSRLHVELAQERASLRTAAKAQFNSIPTTAAPPLSAARLHAIYGVLLAHLLYLTERDEQLVQRELRVNPFGTELIDYPDGKRAPAAIKLCSMPTISVQSQAVGELSKWFDLTGVPGFFRTTSSLPQSPTERRLDPWRINLPYAAGLLAPYDNGSGYIIGIRIYLFTEKRRSVASSFLKTPFLLSSKGLPMGAKAIACREELAA